MNNCFDINQSIYSKQIEDKISKLYPIFHNDYNVNHYEIKYSPKINFRMRAEFSVYHTDDTFQYVMFSKDSGKKNRVFLEKFDYASKIINEFMPILKNLIVESDVLKNKLFGIDFLSTLSNELLITLTYHKVLDNSWINAAKILDSKLKKINNKVDIIGRAKKQRVVINRDYVYEQLCVKNKLYTYHQVENSFTQPNAIINQQMLEWVLDKTSNLKGDLLELYCGNGNFSIALSNNFNKVLATEISKTSVDSAQINISNNHINNLKIIKFSAEEFTQAINGVREFNRLKIQNINLNDYNFSTILVDPPRAGLDEYTLSMVTKYNNIIYISCNPTTLLNNLQTICKTHLIESLCFFDQFPYTDHLETGVILKRRL